MSFSEKDFAKALLSADEVLVEKTRRISYVKSTTPCKENEKPQREAAPLAEPSTGETEQLSSAASKTSSAEVKGILKLVGCGFMRGSRKSCSFYFKGKHI